MMNAPVRTVAGQVQRGLGRGARAVTDAGIVRDCVRRDHRWWWAIDDRAVYLARLIRDLGVPVAPIVARLHTADPDDDNEFSNTLDVLEALGRAGVDGVVEEVRRYVRDGPAWREALETVAAQWPVDWWDDLLPVVSGRIEGDLFGPPWDRWGLAKPPKRPRPPLRHWSDAALLEVLRDPGRSAEHGRALREFGRRPPVPELLDVVDGLDAPDVYKAVAPLGAAALPAARRWARSSGPLRWPGFLYVTEHGEDADVPVLLDGIAWLDSRRGDLCGYDRLVTGLARIGGPATAGVPELLRRLWVTPHSYERASYLRAYLALDPDGAVPGLREGLWDCEADVRLLAAQRVPLSEPIRERLRYLRDDPIEAPDVRGAAAARLEN